MRCCASLRRKSSWLAMRSPLISRSICPCRNVLCVFIIVPYQYTSPCIFIRVPLNSCQQQSRTIVSVAHDLDSKRCMISTPCNGNAEFSYLGTLPVCQNTFEVKLL